MDNGNSTTEHQPNRVEDAAQLLEKFCAGVSPIVSGICGLETTVGDDRAAVIAVQLLAIATQLERIADTLENRS